MAATMERINRSGAREKIRDQKRELNSIIRDAQRECDHKGKHSGACESVHETEMYVKDRNNLSQDTVICKLCGDIFEVVAYKPQEVENAVNVIRSMVNQIKLLNSMTDEEYADLVKVLTYVDEKIAGTLVPYYLNMIKRLGDDNRRKGNNGGGKGRIGLSMGVNSRSFN